MDSNFFMVIQDWKVAIEPLPMDHSGKRVKEENLKGCVCMFTGKPI